MASASDRPPDIAVEHAVHSARHGRDCAGGCVKSNRGAAIFDPFRITRRGNPTIVGWGYNGQPDPFACTGTDACNAACGTLCMHAEERAILWAIGHHHNLEGRVAELELVHVKIGEDRHLVAGGPPSCVQCSRKILDVKWLGWVWLYEAPHSDALVASWVRYSAVEFHRQSMLNSKISP